MLWFLSFILCCVVIFIYPKKSTICHFLSLQLVELKNGETYNGHLVSCDNWMNINLREVICTSRVKLSSAFISLWPLTEGWLFFSKHSLFNVEIWYDLDILTLLLPSDRMEISSGGCPNATLEEAPSSICESQTRSSTWWRRKWCQKAVDAAALSRTKCRAKVEEGLVEVSGMLPAT